MKGLKVSLVVFGTILMTLGIYWRMSDAFHAGGVAECEGCHSMHSPSASGSFLLKGATKSETCLACHEGSTLGSYRISTPGATLTTNPVQRTPGGDFAWQKRVFTYTYTPSGGTPTTYTETGGGHMINAPFNGYIPGTGNAPGGAFPASQLECSSCHDPHGKYRRSLAGTISTGGAPIWASGSYRGTNVADNEPKATGEAVGVYRLLGGMGYTPAEGTGIMFPGNPAAKAPSTYNRTEASTQTRVSYGRATSGGHAAWGTWCATCHGAMHSGTTSSYVHPTDQNLGSGIANLYNLYKKSGDMSGTSADSYLSLVPFISNTDNYTTLASNVPGLTGPGTTDQVSCLSCHRAHASGFAHMLRFDLGYEFVTKGGQYIGSDNPEVGTTGRGPLQSRGRTNADWQAAYYDRPATVWATYQRVLCNKCHAKD